MLFEGVPITTCARKRTYNFQQLWVTKKAVCGLLIMHIYVIDHKAVLFRHLRFEIFKDEFKRVFSNFFVFSLWLFKSAGTIVSAFGCNPKVCNLFSLTQNTSSKAMLVRTAFVYWLSDSNIWKEIFQIIGSRELRFWPCLIYIFRARAWPSVNRK